MRQSLFPPDRSSSFLVSWTLSRQLYAPEEYSFPLLRWLGMPLFRVGVVLGAGPLAVTGRATWLSWVGEALVLISLAVDLGDSLVSRLRRHDKAVS
jgi:hypothetical protein